MKKALILIVVFSTACQGGKKVNPNSSGAVNIIRVSELKQTQEQPTTSVLPNGSVVPHKPNVTSEELPMPVPAPPTVQRNKVDIVIREPENGPAVPMVITKPMTTLEKADAWIHDHGALISYYLVAFTGVLMAWLLWTVNNQRKVLNSRKPTKRPIKPKKRASAKRPAKKAAKKTTAKKAAKKTAKKRAPKKKS